MQSPEEYAAQAEYYAGLAEDEQLSEVTRFVSSNLAAANATLALVAVEVRNNR